MNNFYLADLHVHSVLSPCAMDEMTPDKIISLAKEMGINMLAISDHNSSANVIVAMQLAKQAGILLIPAMETECREEAHILTLFPGLEELLAWQKIVDKNMSGLNNDTRRLGRQLIVDANGNVLGEESRMLLGSLKLSAQEVANIVNELGGICIPAHIDRPAYSLLGQLGFISKKQGYIAVEVSRRGLESAENGKYRKLTDNMNFISNSDAHDLGNFLEGAKTKFYMPQLSFEFLKKALTGTDGCFVKPLKSLFEDDE